VQPRYTSSDQVPKDKPVDELVGSQGSPSLPIPPEAIKIKPLDFSRGFGDSVDST